MARKDFVNFKDWAISLGPVNKGDWESQLRPNVYGVPTHVIEWEPCEPWRTATIKNLVTGKIVTWNVGGKPLRLYNNKEKADLIRSALPYFEEE